MNLGFYMPTKVIVGKDCVRENSDVFKIGKKALIVTGKNSAKLSGALDDVKYALEKNNIEYVIFDKVMSNPTVECVYDGAETAMEEEVDFVIAIGGGSPMDSAKAIALLAVSDIERKNLFDGNIGNKALPMIHIPTTAGTGSEVTPYAILTNHEKQTKKSIAAPCLFPTYALLDAKYTKNLGLATTVNTAIDSLSHSVEGMMSKRANIMADVIAKEAVKIIASTFDDLISGELTEDDREKLLYASMLGGVVISQTKTGSEVTPYAILTNHEKQTKKSIAAPCLFPTYALLDAKYTKNLGLATTVNTAIDSLSHSVEGMMSKRANIMADVIAKEAVKIIASTFDDLISGELTEDDREKLLYASMLGGVVISQTKTTAVHAMGYSLTYFKNIDHGRANGLLLGEFTKYIERNDKDRVEEILSCMNLDSAEEFKNILAKILGDKEKFEKEELELYAEIAQNAGGTLNSMFVPSKDEILQIYVESLM